MKNTPVFLLVVLAIFSSSACRVYNPKAAFDPAATPPAPRYADPAAWCALPDRADAPDHTPAPGVTDRQHEAQIDVFFLHPTTLTGEKKADKVWNASVANARLNDKTDEGSIAHQASIFNGSCRVFAPRYRQAHYHAFFTKDISSADQALDTAFADVEAAFDYYLEHWNQGRPFIIAGHSQGARHAMHLIRNRIEKDTLAPRLVAAYFAGWPVPNTFFTQLPACQSPEQTGCFCSWRTFERRYGLRHAKDSAVVCTNPILWTTQENAYAGKELHQGAILLSLKTAYPHLCDAEVHRGVLLCSKPKFPGSWLLLRTHNYHPGDMNFYYFNIRSNVAQRIENYMKKKGV